MDSDGDGYLACEECDDDDPDRYPLSVSDDCAGDDDGDEGEWLWDTAESIADNYYWWHGVNDIYIEGDFRRVDESGVTYEDWCSGEPNNSHGGECSSDSEEDCVVIGWGGDPATAGSGRRSTTSASRVDSVATQRSHSAASAATSSASSARS